MIEKIKQFFRWHLGNILFFFHRNEARKCSFQIGSTIVFETKVHYLFKNGQFIFKKSFFEENYEIEELDKFHLKILEATKNLSLLQEENR